jgi:hypothetical protein
MFRTSVLSHRVQENYRHLSLINAQLSLTPVRSPGASTRCMPAWCPLASPTSVALDPHSSSSHLSFLLDYLNKVSIYNRKQKNNIGPNEERAVLIY